MSIIIGKTELDPTGAFGVTEDNLMSAVEMLGMIPHWILTIEEGADVKEKLAELYGFGELCFMFGGEVGADGGYSYPEDPDLPPLAKWDREQETIYQYSYGIVAIVYKDGRDTFVVRMD